MICGERDDLLWWPLQKRQPGAAAGVRLPRRLTPSWWPNRRWLSNHPTSTTHPVGRFHERKIASTALTMPVQKVE